MLADRIAWGASLGATLACTRGRVATSAPILRRFGFRAVGSQRCYRAVLT